VYLQLSYFAARMVVPHLASFAAGYLAKPLIKSGVDLMRMAGWTTADEMNGLSFEELRDRLSPEVLRGHMERIIGPPVGEFLVSNLPPMSTPTLKKVYVVTITVIPAVVEELIFRKRMKTYLVTKCFTQVFQSVIARKVAGIALASLAFSAFHLSNYLNTNAAWRACKAQLISTVALGGLAGVAKEALGFPAAIAVHAGYNFKATTKVVDVWNPWG
jgi:hypothetical protein